MRPVIRGPRPATYNPDDNLGTSKNSEIYRKLGYSITVGTATAAVWRVSLFDMKITKKRPADYDDYDKLVKNIYKNLEKRYPLAGRPLVAALGDFCCYCEIAGTSFEVDHAVPKRPFIGTIVDWNNLLPTCPVCNRLKSNNPQIESFIASIINKTDQDQYKQYIRDKYYWPDTYANSYGPLYPLLCYDDAGTWKPLKSRYAFSTNINILADNPIRRLVTCEFTRKNGTKVTYDTRAYIIDGINDSDVKATITLLNLNRIQDVTTGDISITDLRIYKRTQVWLMALRRVRPLTIYGGSDWEQAWRDLIQDAKTAGYFCVWVKVLSHWEISGLNLARKFINEVSVPNLFPGTNVAGILDEVP